MKDFNKVIMKLVFSSKLIEEYVFIVFIKLQYNLYTFVNDVRKKYIFLLLQAETRLKKILLHNGDRILIETR